VSRHSDGLYEVRVDSGPPLLTHGPDPPSAFLHRDILDPPVIAGESSVSLRQPICATDHYQRIFYARPSSAPDRSAAVAPTIRRIVQTMDATLNEDSLASGGPTADYKVLCDSSGAIRIDSLTTSDGLFSTIVNAVTSLLGGLLGGGGTSGVTTVNRTIFFDGTQSNTCGLGSFLPDEQPGAANANNSGGGTAIVYQPCWDAETAMHENGHNQGAVQNGAPDSTGLGAHCWDEEDIMCYSPDGGTKHQGGTSDRCIDRIHFDCDHNDYFNTSSSPGGYLATHWNIGSRVNRFLVFNQGAQPTPTLKRGRYKTGYTGTPGSWRYFKVKLPKGARKLRFTLSGCATVGCQPNLDLFARPRHKPTLASFKRSSQGPTSVEAVKIARPKVGLWFAGVYARSGNALSQFSIRATYKKRR
jgi:hypothetical protein